MWQNSKKNRQHVTCLVFTTNLCWFCLAILYVISFWSLLSTSLISSTSAHSVQHLILCTVNIPAQKQTTQNYHSMHTHTHPFNGPFSGTTQVSQYQKGKTNLDFTEARDSEWQWHQQICKSASRSRQITTPVPHHSKFFTGRMPFLSPNQQRQSTEGRKDGTEINPWQIPKINWRYILD